MRAVGSAPRALGAVAGVVAAAAGLAAAQLTTFVHSGLQPPVTAVGDAVVRYSPSAVTSWAIALFGTADKVVLQVGVHVVLAGLSAGIGVLAVHSFVLAGAATVLLGGVGALAALDGGAGAVAAVVPAAAAIVVGLAVLGLLLATAVPAPPARAPATGGATDETTSAPARRSSPTGKPALTRRRFLRTAGAVAVLTAGAHTLVRYLEAGAQAAAERAALVLPAAGRRQDLPVPGAAHPDVAGLPPFITPNEDFYRIDTALRVPRVDPSAHEIRVRGMVERELTLSFDELLSRDSLEVPMNLICVSNEIGGDLVDAAVWQGVLLREVLDEAGVADEATQVVGRSVDGYTCGFPVELAYDRPALLAFGMNGEPLPFGHGFPVRLVTPGIYGYVGSTKWLSEIELSRFGEFTQYWARRGYADHAPVKLSSRIDVPRASAAVPAGTVAVAGTAWAPVEGVGGVEVRVDDGPWREAQLAAPANTLTWRQWVYRWDASPGRHRLTVRATDATGARQVAEYSDPKPDGATGYHTVPVTVRPA